MWPTRSRTSHSVQRVWTFQFFGSSTRSKNFCLSRRRISRTVSFPSAAIGLTGATRVLTASSPPCQGAGAPAPPSAAERPRARARSPPSALPVGSGERGDLDRRQVEVEVLAPVLVLRRQLQGRPERLGRLVHREARAVGGDLEEDAPRLPEVDGAEVLAL